MNINEYYDPKLANVKKTSQADSAAPDSNTVTWVDDVITELDRSNTWLENFEYRLGKIITKLQGYQEDAVLSELPVDTTGNNSIMLQHDSLRRTRSNLCDSIRFQIETLEKLI